MNMTNLPALLGATHVAFGTITAERLERIGATQVARACDCLLVGPSRRDVAEHARARQAWWSSSEQWDVYWSEVSWQPPVVVWVSTSLHERVNLWKTCSWLRQMGIACQDVFILEFDAVPPSGTPEEPLPPFDCTASVADHPDKVLLERLDQARPWPCERYDSAVRLWDMYIDANPLPFVQSCTDGIDGFPDLASLWMLLSRFFPRRTPEGALRLSRFDELLLSILSMEWQTPLDVFIHKSQSGMALRQLLYCTGDLFLPHRLEQWAAHGPSAAMDRAAGPKPPFGYPLLSSVYRISERGIQLREAGLEALADAPTLPIGGTEAYGAPWVLLDDGRLIRL